MKTNEIRKMKPADMDKKLSETRLEMSKELGHVKMGRAVKNPGKIGNMRKLIARILTVKRENERSENKTPKEVKTKNA